jgi:hypothetical protein
MRPYFLDFLSSAFRTDDPAAFEISLYGKRDQEQFWGRGASGKIKGDIHKCINRMAFGKKSGHLPSVFISGEQFTHFFTVSEGSNTSGDGTGSYRNNLLNLFH